MDDRFDRLVEGLRRLLHDTRNPLSVVSGNAQLLAEVAPSYGFDDLVSTAVADLAEAAEELAACLGRLDALRADLSPDA